MVVSESKKLDARSWSRNLIFESRLHCPGPNIVLMVIPFSFFLPVRVATDLLLFLVFLKFLTENKRAGSKYTSFKISTHVVTRRYPFH